MTQLVKNSQNIIFLKVWSKLPVCVNLRLWWRNCPFVWTESMIGYYAALIMPSNCVMLIHSPLKCCFNQMFQGAFWLGFSRCCVAEYLIPLRRRAFHVVDTWYLENTSSALWGWLCLMLKSNLPSEPSQKCYLNFSSLLTVSKLHCLPWTAQRIFHAQQWK